MKIVERHKTINKHSRIGDIVKFYCYNLKIIEEESCLYCFFYNKDCPKISYCKYFSREYKKNIVYKKV